MRHGHYAWLVCLGGGAALFAVMGLGVNVFSIYQPEIIRLNGFTDAQGSWITTTRSLLILAGLLLVNQLCERFGLRLVMTLGVALGALAHLCFAFAGSFPVYCLAAALMGFGYCFGGMVPLSLVIGRWFRGRRSFALGLAAAGSGVSTIFAPVLLTRVMETHGMRSAFLWESLIFALCALLVWVLVRDSPESIGLEPYTGGPTAASPTAGTGIAPQWRPVLLLAAVLLGGPVGPAFSHLTMLYTSSGYSGLFVAGLLSYLGVAIMLGKALCGQVYDRWGSWRGNWYTFGTMLFGLLLCCLAGRSGAVLPVLAITAFGQGLSITAVSPARWAADLYGERDYASGVRAVTVAYTAGMLLFGPVPGILADRFGGYVPSYGFFTLCLLGSMAIVQGLYRSQLKR